MRILKSILILLLDDQLNRDQKNGNWYEGVMEQWIIEIRTPSIQYSI